MTKPQLAVAAVVGWVAIHGGLVVLGAVLGIGLSIPLLGHSTISQPLHCQEDEVAIHGGLTDWYNPDLPLACVNFDEFPELHPFDYEQWRAEIYRDGFMEGHNEGLSDTANTEVGEVWSAVPTDSFKKAWCKVGGQLTACALHTNTPKPTPAPTPTPEPEVRHTTMTVSLTFYTCEPFCLGDPMYNGAPLHVGAVACGWALQDGQVFEFDGETYTCEDRGGAVSAYWVDFWMPDRTTGYAWQARVGTIGEIILLVEA